MKSMSWIAGALALIMAAGAAQAEDLVITNAKVHVEPGQVLDSATIVIRDGVIRAVGSGAAVPAGARVIDGTGKIVTAGFIESATRVGLSEVGLEKSTREGSFEDDEDTIHAAYRVSDGYNSRSMAIAVARSQGVTSVVSEPEGGLIAGTSGWFSLADGLGRDVVVKAPLAMHASLGESALDVAQGSRGMALTRLREVLDDARIYSRERRSYERNQTRAFAASRLDLEALLPVLQGRVPLVIRADRSSDILAAIQLGQELGVRVIVAGGTEAWMVADRLAAARVGVIVNPILNLPFTFDRIHVRDDNAALLAAAGVDVVVSGMGEPSAAGTLRQLAGNAVAQGLPWEHALAAVTTVPAKIFGVERGAVRAGAAADLVVWSGDPFELSSHAEHVIIGGKEQSTRNRQTLLLERYRTLAQ